MAIWNLWKARADKRMRHYVGIDRIVGCLASPVHKEREDKLRQGLLTIK